MLTSVETSIILPSDPWSLIRADHQESSLFSHPQESFRSGFFQLIIWSPSQVQRNHSSYTRLWYREFLWGSSGSVRLNTQHSHFFWGVLLLPGTLPWKEAQVFLCIPQTLIGFIWFLPPLALCPAPHKHTVSVKRRSRTFSRHLLTSTTLPFPPVASLSHLRTLL